jgi:glycosyltransferase involved in cell wall biosynthesis
MPPALGHAPSICILAPLAFRHRSGIARYQTELVRHLSSSAPIHVLLHPGPSSRRVPDALAATIPRARVHHSGALRPTVGKTGTLVGRFFSRSDLLDYSPRTWGALFTTRILDGLAVDTLGFDLFHATQNYLPDTRGAARRVVTILDTIPLDLPDQVSRTTRRTFLLPSELREEDTVLFISKAAEAAFLRHFDHPAQTRRVFYLGIDQTIFAPGAEAARLPESPPYLLSVGMFEPRKNLVRALRAFEAMAGDSPNLRWKLTGTPGFGHGAFLEELASSPARGRIDVLEVRSDSELASLYRGAAALVFPSTAEGFGLPVVEALACGTPVAASEIDAVTEAGGGAIVPFDPLDVDAIRDAALKAAFDPTGRAARRARGLAHASTFTWPRTARAHLEAYAAALNCPVSDLLGETDAPQADPA